MSADVRPEAPSPATFRVRLGTRSCEEWISLTRVFLLLTLIPALWFGVIPMTHPSVATIVVLLGAYVILLAVGPRWIRLFRKVDLIIALDILVVTLVVIISGNLNSPFLYLYYLTILEAAARLNLRQAIAASLAMAGMIVLLWTRAGEGTALETTGFRLGAVIAGGFFLALFLGMLVQEYRANLERARWTDLLDRRLREATEKMEAQLQELQFYNDLASHLSGELRVEGVIETLLRVFLETVRMPKGVAYVIGEDETPRFSAAQGFDWAEAGRAAGDLSLPILPSGAAGGEVVIHRVPSGDGQPDRVLACVPLIRAGGLRGWLCALGDIPEAFTESVLRRVRGMAAQGVSALEAARLHEEVQHMGGADPSRSLFPWSGVQKLVADEIRRCTGLLLVFSIAEIQLEDYAGDTVAESDRDFALRRAIKVLQTSLRRVDVVAHDGAGRFAILLPRVAKINAVDILQRLIRRLEEDAVAAQLFSVKRLMISAGVVAFPEDGTTVTDLFDKLSDLLAQGPSTPGCVKVPVA
ncbi:MAG TPA: diguanylate cyclase [bacterium]|nr:diguanylate cyclase [bacterium]